MKKQVETVLFLYLLAFVGLLSASFVRGSACELVKLLAFSLPIIIGTLVAKRQRREREEKRGVCEPYNTLFELDRSKTLLLLPLVFPFVLLMLGTSYLTVVLLSLVGVEPTGGELTGGIFYLLIMHAVVPAVLEEGLFRYLSMRILRPVSIRACVITSALGFAAFHLDLFSMPYALVAGVVLIFVDICFNSILPSFVLHLVNNVCSVLWSVYCNDRRAVAVYLSVLSGLSLMSVALLYLLRKRYVALAKDAFADRETVCAMSFENNFGD